MDLGSYQVGYFVFLSGMKDDSDKETTRILPYSLPAVAPLVRISRVEESIENKWLITQRVIMQV